jgi:zinc protease
LANGLRLIVAKDDGLETVTVSLALSDAIPGRVLPNSEHDALPALALEALRQDVEACCGWQANTATSLSRAGAQLSISTLPADLEPILLGLAAALGQPAKRTSFERSRATESLPWLLGANRVFRSLDAVSDALLYGEQPPQPSVLHLSSDETNELPALSLEQLRHFRSLHYRPQDAALIVVGPVAFDQVEVLARAAFEGWPSAAIAAPVGPPAPRAQGPRRAFRYSPLRKDSDFAVIAVPCAQVGSTERLVLEVLAAWFKTLGSTLARGLRHDSGISYSWSAGCDGEDAAATFHVHLTSAPGEAHLAIEVVLNELSRLALHPLAPGELEQAGTTYLSAQANELSTGRGAARALGTAFLAGLPDGHYESLEDRVRAITPAQLQSVANRYFETGPMIIVASTRKLELRHSPRLAAAFAAGR